MLKIRLSRIGKSNSPIFRLVVAEKTRAVKRENLEILGLYNPTKKDNKFSANKERVLFWISKGAQPSETVNNLLCDFDILPKKDKLNIVHGRATKKKVAKELTTQNKTPMSTDKNVAEAGSDEAPAEESAEVEVAEEVSEPKVKEKIEELENIKEETTPTTDTEEVAEETSGAAEETKEPESDKEKSE